MPPFLFTRRIAPLAFATLLGVLACTPQYDWRDTRSPDGSFFVLMPAKPSIATRPVNVNGQQFSMTMTAAEVNKVTFAVGTIRVPEPNMTAATMVAMKDALLKNIGSSPGTEKITTSANGGSITIDVQAIGQPGAASKGQPVALHLRLVAKDAVVYQALVAGPQNAVTSESVDTFMTSLKVN